MRHITKDPIALKVLEEELFKKRNRPISPWHDDQCGQCAFYIGLQRPLTEDWGACANMKSPRFSTVMFEHDGCEAFVLADWDGEPPPASIGTRP